MTDEQRRAVIRAREQAENTKALNKARETGKNVTFIAEDGCEVTVTPSGNVFHNILDWY